MIKFIHSLRTNKEQSARNMLELEKSNLFDIYTIALAIILIANIFLNLFIKEYIVSTVFFVLSLFMISTLFWPDKIRFNKKILLSLFFFIGLFIFITDGLSNGGAMNYLSYISAVIALAFFFDYKEDKYKMFFLIVSYLVGFLINSVTKYSLFDSFSISARFSQEKYFYSKIYKTLEVSFCTIVGMYFIYRKERMISSYNFETKKLNALLKKTDKINFSGELYELAMSKNPLFITYFKSEFSDFFEKILLTTPGLISSELEICALMKLNLTTKEISIATNSTIKSVENKKHRIRKKLDVSSEIDLSLYVINTF